MDDADENTREALIAQNDFEGVFRLAERVCEKAARQRNRFAYEQWSEYQVEAGAAAGDPYFQALLGDVNRLDPIDKIGSLSGASALMGAAFVGNVALVRSLLERGASIDILDGDERTPLIAAADEDHAEIVRILVERGADLGARDKNGQTALHFTAWQGHVAAARALLELGADPSIADERGFLPVHMATNAPLEMLRLLVSASGVDCRTKDKCNATPLMRAAKEGNLENMRALIEMGADARLRDGDGDTAADYAEQYGQDDAVRFLHSLRDSSAGSKPAEETPPPVLLTWETSGSDLRLRWEIAHVSVADASQSSLWDDYRKAVEITSQGRWSLTGTRCAASPHVPLVNRTIEPMAYYDRVLNLFDRIEHPAEADELVRCASLFARAVIELDLAAEQLTFSPEEAFEALRDIMGPRNERVVKPFDLVTHWLAAMGIFGTLFGKWPEITAILHFLQDVNARLEAMPHLQSEMEGFFEMLIQRGFERHLEDDGPANALLWTRELITLLESPATILLPLRNASRMALMLLKDYDGVDTLAREVIEWGRRNDEHDVVEDWEAYAQKAATLADRR